jgi:hypothetical protein
MVCNGSFAVFFLHDIDFSVVNPREFLAHPVITSRSQPLSSVIGETVMCGMIRHHKAFLEHAQQQAQIHDEWRCTSTNFVKTFRNLTKSIRELEREVQSESPQSSTKTQR